MPGRDRARGAITRPGPEVSPNPSSTTGSIPRGGTCGCCATGERRAALDRLQAQNDARRIATALHNLGADLTAYYGPRRWAA